MKWQNHYGLSPVADPLRLRFLLVTIAKAHCVTNSRYALLTFETVYRKVPLYFVEVMESSIN
jgi:hypothetical protein